MQRKILLDRIHYIREITKPETIIKLPYKWKGRKKMTRKMGGEVSKGYMAYKMDITNSS